MSVFMGILVAGLVYWVLETVPMLRRLTHRTVYSEGLPATTPSNPGRH